MTEALFRPLPDHELQRLDDDSLLAYIGAARDARDAESTQRGLAIMVFGYWGSVVARLAMKLPAQEVDDVAAEVMSHAITSTFSGQSRGEFRVWLNTIVDRRAADFYRARGRHIDAAPLPGPDSESDDLNPAVEPMAPDERGYVETRAVVEEALEALSSEHRRVVEMLVFDGEPADRAAAEVDGMSVDNAYQVAHRFRTRLRTMLETAA